MRRLISSALILSFCLVSCSDNSGYVDMFMGTAGDHGQLSPAAQLPFGLVSVCPDTNRNAHTGYDYDVTEVLGISVDRMHGTGGDGAGGNIRIRPCAATDTVRIVKESEKAVPGYYRTELSNGVSVELTATSNVAIEKYLFPREVRKVMSVDFLSSHDRKFSDCSWTVVGDRDIVGWVSSSTVCRAGIYKLYFKLHADSDFTVSEKDGKKVELSFDDSEKEIEIRVALSPVDEASAAYELTLIEESSFNSIRIEAAKQWSRILSVVDVKGSTKEQKTIFYTSLYRICMSPFNAMGPDGRYRASDGNVYEAEGWDFYSGWSMWDTFRTKFPMLCLLCPDQMNDFCRSLIRLYETNKMNWAGLTEPVPTVRTEHSQVTLLDAWRKGIRGFEFTPEAFAAMEKENLQGLVPGSKQGLTRNTPDNKLETSYDLWAMSEIASIMGLDSLSTKYGADADSLFEATWKSEFMTITDEYTKMKGNGLYQGTRWQYRWGAPIFADKMIEWCGEEQLADELSEFFERHLFNQGNEPDIQTPFMFNLFGHPERTDSIAHALLTDEEMIHIYGGNAEFSEPFVGRAFRDRPDGYAPEMDEDDGTMSAWYMFTQMGFYPVCVGTDRYEMFTPLFKKVVLHLKDHDVTISRRCPEASASRIIADGKPLDGFSISHSDLISSRQIIFE